MSVSRRDFLKGAVGGTAVAAVPVGAWEKLRHWWWRWRYGAGVACAPELAHNTIGGVAAMAEGGYEALPSSVHALATSAVPMWNAAPLPPVTQAELAALFKRQQSVLARALAYQDELTWYNRYNT